MGVFEIVLSSAVIAAVISFIANEKTNQLTFITSERSKWRAEIKEIAGELSECKKYNKRAKRLLVDLKLRINAYGRKREYSEDICADVFRDEHIYKEIDAIEKGKDFDFHRNRLLRYIELLLKYDWERSKREAKSEQKIVVMSIFYIVTMIGSVLFDYIIIKGFNLDSGVHSILINEGIVILLQTFALILFLAPYLLINIGIFSVSEIYRNVNLFLLTWSIGMIILYVTATVQSFQTDYNTMYYFFFVIQIGIGLIIFMQNIEGLRHFRDYDNAVRENFEDEKVFIYATQSALWTIVCFLSVEATFNTYEIKYESLLQPEPIDEDKAKAAIRLLYKLPYEIARFRYQMSASEYLNQNPKSCKMYVRKGNEICIGFHSNWKDMAKKIRKNAKTSNIEMIKKDCSEKN